MLQSGPGPGSGPGFLPWDGKKRMRREPDRFTSDFSAASTWSRNGSSSGGGHQSRQDEVNEETASSEAEERGVATKGSGTGVKHRKHNKRPREQDDQRDMDMLKSFDLTTISPYITSVEEYEALDPLEIIDNNRKAVPLLQYATIKVMTRKPRDYSHVD